MYKILYNLKVYLARKEIQKQGYTRQAMVNYKEGLWKEKDITFSIIEATIY